MEKTELSLRMYGLVVRSLSPIQQGIQFAHAAVEYGLLYGDTEEYLNWAKMYKTVIVLNGGTTSTNPFSLGTINSAKVLLDAYNIMNAPFYEPDLGDQMTAIAFILDERVWNVEKWPEFVFDASKWESEQNGPSYEKQFERWANTFNASHEEVQQIMKIRSFIFSHKLA